LRGPRRILAAAAALLVVAGGAPAGPPAVMPPPPDDAAGLRATLAQARAAGSNAALIRFIARHPDEPLTGLARAALRARTAPDPRSAPGPDGAIVAAFDRARLAGPAALAGFAAATPNHPLGAEARRADWVADEVR
jgi:hypothetical protein